MQHASIFHDMTFSALSKRADQIEHVGTMADILGTDEDYRDVAIYFAHEGGSFLGGVAGYWTGTAAEVIGVVIGGDDPAFAAEVLDRGQAQDRFGHEWVSRCEERATEGLQ